MSVITVTSQKGGVGKTTTAVTLAHGLAKLGKKVLLVDIDPQGHTAICLGMDPAPGIFDYLVVGSPVSNVVLDTQRQGLWLLPGNSRTKTAEKVVREESSLDEVAHKLRQLVRGYDYTVIDTAASGFFQEVALALANVVIVPVRLEQLGMEAIAPTLQTCKQVGHPDVIVVLPVGIDNRVAEHSTNLKILQENYPGVVPPPVPQRIAVAEAVAVGQTIWEYSGNVADVRKVYTTLLDWVTADPSEVVFGKAGNRASKK